MTWPAQNRKLSLILLVLFLATLAVVGYLFYSLLTLDTLSKQTNQAVLDTSLLQDLYTQIRSAESGQRGFVITGDESYLGPYNDALTAVPHNIQTLDQRSAVKDTSSYKQLKQLIPMKMAELKLTIDLRRTQGADAATAVVANNHGKDLMQQIHRLIVTETSGELQNVVPKQREAQHNLHRALYIGVILVTFVFATCMVILHFFQAAIMRERAVEGAKNEFLSLASHQLRTPATNVKQYLGLILEGYLGKLKPEQLEAIEVANRNNNTEISIINDLLNVAKLDLNKITLHKHSLDLAKLLRQLGKEQQAHAEHRQQRIKLVIPKNLPSISGDSTYLRSAIENLIDNACKYSPERSTVTLKAATVGQLPHQSVTISVSDSGIGIAKRDVSKLFKKFSRLPSAIDSAEGSGLGLYWVKQIIELHQGQISVVSEYKKGSTFIITLPV